MYLVLFVLNKSDRLGDTPYYNLVQVDMDENILSLENRLKYEFLDECILKKAYLLNLRKPIPDFARYSDLLFVSSKGMKFLLEHINSSFKFFPIDLYYRKTGLKAEKTMYIVNLANSKKCINKNDSIKMESRYSGKLLSDYRYIATYENIIDDIVWEDGMSSALFCSNRFKELVEKERISGLFFADLKTTAMPMGHAANVARQNILKKRKKQQITN